MLVTEFDALKNYARHEGNTITKIEMLSIIMPIILLMNKYTEIYVSLKQNMVIKMLDQTLVTAQFVSLFHNLVIRGSRNLISFSSALVFL